MRWWQVQPLLLVDGFSVQRVGGPAVELPALVLQPGRVAALYGPSGCGKTTILRGLFGLLGGRSVVSSGRVHLLGRDLTTATAAERSHALRHAVTFLPQDAEAALDPLLAVGQQIVQATGRSETEAATALGGLGVRDAAGLCRRLPHQISGGQAQRVLLAIAFLRAPALVVADEPSASLGGGSFAELLVQLRRLLANGSAVLLATHDHRLLRELDASVYAAVAGRFVPGEPDQAPWPLRSDGDGLGSVPVLAARSVRVAFGERVVLDEVDFELRRGEIVAVTGESGAGKTTLARVLAGHRRPDGGRMEAPPRRAAVQLCCQDAFASLSPGRSLRSLVAEARAPGFDLDTTAALLQMAPAAVDRAADQMSGGERRRAALLRALAVQPDVLVLDEPTASLDRASSVAVLASLLELQRRRGLSLVLVTHDHDLARAVANRVVVVQAGKVTSC